MKAKAVKTAELEFLKTTLAEHPSVVLCTFQGIKVAEDFQLRSKVRAAGAGYRVVPNRLARLASAGTPAEATFGRNTGMTSLVYTKDDPVELLKALVEYSKQNPVFAFKAGVVEGQALDVDRLTELSKMPGKQELQAKLLYLLNAPAQQLMGVLKASARDLASVVKKASEEGKFTS